MSTCETATGAADPGEPDPTLAGRTKARWRDLLRTGRRGITAGYGQFLRALPPSFRPSYHTSQHGSTSQAIAYLAKSPAAQAAAQ